MWDNDMTDVDVTSVDEVDVTTGCLGSLSMLTHRHV